MQQDGFLLLESEALKELRIDEDLPPVRRGGGDRIRGNRLRKQDQ